MPRWTPEQAQRDLERVAKRLGREERAAATTSVVRCAQHGVSYACPGARYDPFYTGGSISHYGASCGHTACTRVLSGECPDCETT